MDFNKIIADALEMRAALANDKEAKKVEVLAVINEEFVALEAKKSEILADLDIEFADKETRIQKVLDSLNYVDPIEEENHTDENSQEQEEQGTQEKEEEQEEQENSESDENKVVTEEIVEEIKQPQFDQFGNPIQ